eukprot:CAMPEP_0180700656 /NCGR_PEP_ID=MMETSP1038_2-20121128/5190_1 /TAXON_ID=632150 /ORGANISM="Azadinium spinosum, Strain 3D9" /LENGTH=94 /DNA_ID=CAMNT_0022732339 /DNA_START=57 /DNA_END=341 /DNA_ORIENTATION=+
MTDRSLVSRLSFGGGSNPSSREPHKHGGIPAGYDGSSKRGCFPYPHNGVFTHNTSPDSSLKRVSLMHAGEWQWDPARRSNTLDDSFQFGAQKNL